MTLSPKDPIAKASFLLTHGVGLILVEPSGGGHVTHIITVSDLAKYVRYDNKQRICYVYCVVHTLCVCVLCVCVYCVCVCVCVKKYTVSFERMEHS